MASPDFKICFWPVWCGASGRGGGEGHASGDTAFRMLLSEAVASEAID